MPRGGLAHAYSVHDEGEYSGEGSWSLAGVRRVDCERTIHEVEVQQLQPLEDAKRAKKLDKAADGELGVFVGGQGTREAEGVRAA